MTRETRIRYAGLIFYLLLVLSLGLTEKGIEFFRSIQNMTPDIGNNTFGIIGAGLGFGTALLTSDSIGYLFSSIVIFVLNTLGYLPKRYRRKPSKIGILLAFLGIVITLLLQDIMGVIFCSIIFISFLVFHRKPQVSFYSMEFGKFGESLKDKRMKELEFELKPDAFKLLRDLKQYSPDVYSTHLWFQESSQVFEWFVRRYNAFISNWVINLGIIFSLIISQYLVIRFDLRNTGESKFVFWVAIVVMVMLAYNGQQARVDAVQMFEMELTKLYNKETHPVHDKNEVPIPPLT